MPGCRDSPRTDCVSPKTLAARLGHSSSTITFDLYAHALVDDQRDAAQAF
jgi:integrase